MFKLREDSVIKKDSDIGELTGLEIDRYFDVVSEYAEIDFIFLKSMIYAEELIKEINLLVFKTHKSVGLDRQIEQIKLIIGDKQLDKSIFLIQRIKGFRDKMAHNFEYKIENDEDFLLEFKIKKDFNKKLKNLTVIVYFKDVFHGLIFIKVALKNMEDLLIFSFEEK